MNNRRDILVNEHLEAVRERKPVRTSGIADHVGSTLENARIGLLDLQERDEVTCKIVKTTTFDLSKSSLRAIYRNHSVVGVCANCSELIEAVARCARATRPDPRRMTLNRCPKLTDRTSVFWAKYNLILLLFYSK